MNNLMPEEIIIKQLHNVTDVQYSVTEDNTHVTKLTFADNTVKYIFIELGMIFVSDWPLEEFSQHVTEDDCLLYEAYDTADGCAYYLNSDYAAEIADSVINFQQHLLQKQASAV